MHGQAEQSQGLVCVRKASTNVKIQVGYDLTYENVAPTPMIFMLNVHPSRASDLITPDWLRIEQQCSITPYIDGFGNKCVRVLAPTGKIRVWNQAIVADTGKPDRQEPGRASMPSATCRPTRWFICWRADTARPTC